MNKTVLTAIIALLVGVGIGLGAAALFSDDTQPTPSPRAEGKKTESDAPAAKEKIPSGPSPIPSEGPNSEEEVQAEEGQNSLTNNSDSESPKRRSLAEVREYLPTFHTSEIEGEITGEARNHDGSPAVGVLIRAEARVSSSQYVTHSYSRVREIDDGSPPEIDDFKTRNSERLNKYYNVVSHYRREVYTDDQGKFVLSKLLDCDYSIFAFKKGFRAERPGNSYGRLRAGGKLHFVMIPIRMAPIQVLLPDGQPAQEALVSIKAIAGKYSSEEVFNWSSEANQIPFRSNLCKIYAMTKDGKFRSQTKSVVFDTNQPEATTVQLLPSTGVQIQLNYLDYTLLNMSHYLFLAKASLGELEASELRSKAMEIRTDRNPEEQIYRKTELEAGPYRVYLMRNSSIVHQAAVTVVEGELSELEIVVPALDQKDYVVVTIEGLSLEEQADIRFIVGEETPHGFSGSTGARGISRGINTYWVAKRSIAQSMPGSKPVVGATTAMHGDVRTNYDPANAVAHLVFPPSALLELEIEGFDQNDPSHKNARLYLRKGSEAHSRQRKMMDRSRRIRIADMIDGEGKLFITGATAGKYRLELSLNRSHRESVAALVLLDLSAGANRARLKMPALYAMTIEFPALEEEKYGRAELFFGGQLVDSEFIRKVESGPPSWSVGEMPEGEYRVDWQVRKEKRSMTFTHGSAQRILFAPND